MKFVAYVSLLIFGVWISAPVHAQGKLSILQGATSGTITHFTLVAPAGIEFEIIADSGQRKHRATQHEIVREKGSSWHVHRLRFEGLRPGVEYHLSVRDKLGRQWDQRTFGTLDINREQGRIGLASCMLDKLHNPRMWEALSQAENRPDVFFFTGDNVYLDRPTLFKKAYPQSRLDIWKRWVETRQTIDFYYWDRLVPVFSTWDDHDSGGDNVDASFPLMGPAREIFDTFFANEEISGVLESGPSLSFQLKLFGKNFLFMDGRSYRSPSAQSHNMFGEAQEDWLVSRIQSGGNILVNGSQFFGKYIKKDSYEGNWPADFRRFTERLKRQLNEKNGLINFFSGDVHFSEVMHILDPAFFGYPVYEITSSSVHSFAAPGHHLLKPANPRRIEATGTHNALILDLRPVANEIVFDVKSISWRNKLLFSTYTVTNGIWKPSGYSAGRCEGLFL